MLKVDLGELARKKRLHLDASLATSDALLDELGFRVVRPLQIQLEAQQSGPDVLVRGTIEGEAELDCRRCLTPVATPIDEEVALIIREGEAMADEVLRKHSNELKAVSDALLAKESLTKSEFEQFFA